MNIYESITKILADCPAIAKNSRNTQGSGYNYRGIDAVMNVFQPLLAKYKVFVVPQVINHTREERTTKNGGNLIYSIIQVKYTFYAEDGSFVEAVVQGEGMDSSDKSSNKAMSAAFKYAMFQVFCIPTEEMKDPDAETPEESTPRRQGTVAKNATVEPPVMCPVCGKPVKAMKGKNGKNYTPAEVLQLCGMCHDCYTVQMIAEGKQ